jgi:hypothetical protein
VIGMVQALTERISPEERTITDRQERWRAHRRGYFAQIGQAGAGVRRISCADSLHNARTLVHEYRLKGEKIWDRFLTRNGQDQVWAYRKAAEAFQAAGAGPMADELAAAVDELEGLIS